MVPHSLRFVAFLLGCAAVAAVGTSVVTRRQAATTAETNAEQITGGHVKAGEAAIARHGCVACHRIPGFGTKAAVGPALDGIAERTEIAGHLPNQPDAMIAWVRRPQHFAPGTGMPNLPMSEQDARDVAAYLYTLRKSMPNE